MNPFDVDRDDMILDLIDDDAVEAILAGRTEPDASSLRAALGSLRRAGLEDAPAPSAELAALLGERHVPSTTVEEATVVPLAPRRRTRLLRVAGGVGLATKLALGASVAAAAVGGAGAAGVLPSPVEDVVRNVVRTVTTTDDGQDPAPPEPTVPSVPTHVDGGPSSSAPTNGGTDGAGHPGASSDAPVPSTVAPPATSGPQPSPNAADKSANSDDKGANAGEPSPNGTGNGATTGNGGGAADGTGNGNGNAPEVPPGQSVGGNPNAAGGNPNAAGGNPNAGAGMPEAGSSNAKRPD